VEGPEFVTRWLRMGVIGLILMMLVLGGYWLLDGLARSRKAQECLESGRRNCGEITRVP
jgi:hypothetical protein